MKFIAGLIVVIPFLILAGCVGPKELPTTPRTQQFNEDHLKPYGGKGNSVVIGEAFLKTRGGSVKKGAGETVWLVPVVPYFSEYVNKEILGAHKLTPGLEKKAYSYMRTTKADSDGRFRFEEIQPGEYYVYAMITWSVPTSRGLQGTGGMAFATVMAKPNEQVSVVVTF